MTEERNRKLNTPKTGQINQLFLDAIGLKEISKQWKWQGMNARTASTKLDDYISLRGAIAHRGGPIESVRKADVTEYQKHVDSLTAKTHDAVTNFVSEATGVDFS